MAITFQPLKEGDAGDATQIALQAFDTTEVLTALRNGSGNLELISWHIDRQGVNRGADSGHQAGNIDEVSLTISGRQAITAVRNGSGDLELISWEVPEGLKKITRETTAGAGTASSSMPAPIRTLPRQILGSGITGSNPTLRHIRWSSGSTACMPTARACATSRNSSPTMMCRHRASMTRRGIVTVTRAVGRIRRSAPFSTTRHI
jgi:hypothetical protein